MRRGRGSPWRKSTMTRGVSPRSVALRRAESASSGRAAKNPAGDRSLRHRTMSSHADDAGSQERALEGIVTAWLHSGENCRIPCLAYSGENCRNAHFARTVPKRACALMSNRSGCCDGQIVVARSSMQINIGNEQQAASARNDEVRDPVGGDFAKAKARDWSPRRRLRPSARKRSAGGKTSAALSGPLSDEKRAGHDFEWCC